METSSPEKSRTMKETQSISGAAMMLGVGILLSRVLGYGREMLLAYKFGASGMTDAFYAAFQIPDLLNYFLAGGALSIAFIPLYNRVLANDGEEAAHHMMAVVMGTLSAAVVAATALLWWQAPALIAFQFPHFDAARAALTVHLTRIVLPAQVFFITGGIAQAVLLARKNFMAAAVSPLVYNAFIIAGGYFLYPVCGIDGFAIGTLAGAIAGPFLLPLLYMRRHIPLRMKFAPTDRNFLVYLALAAPLMLGQTLLTLDEWYGRWFGALLSTGTIAHLSYARRLMQVPIAVIGQAVAAAALPTLSRLWAEKKTAEMDATLMRTLRTGMFLSVLAGAKFFALARPIVTLVYQHGKFTAADAAEVSVLVAIFSLAIPGWILQQISVRAFYARGDTKRPMIMGTILSVLAIPLYIVLGQWAAAQGIAFAGVIGMTANALATFWLAWRLHGTPGLRGLAPGFLRALLIAVPAAGAAFSGIWARQNFFPVAEIHVQMAALLDIAAGGAAFSVIGIPGILLFGDEGVKSYAAQIGKKLGVTGTATPT